MTNGKEADVVIHGGLIYCGQHLREGFIAIQGNKIVALGLCGQEDEWIGPETTILSLHREQLVLPGLHDNHIHLIQAGMFDKYADLTAASSQEAAAAMTAEFAASIPDRPVYLAGLRASRSVGKQQSSRALRH